MAINRSAEAMTIFAVIMAAIFPGIHMGRIWVSYWVLPLPNQFGSLWVNFQLSLAVGRVCDFDVLLGVLGVLVHRLDS